MKKPVIVVKVNADYQTELLEELGAEAVRPWGDFMEFHGVHPVVESVEFYPPMGPDGVPMWAMQRVSARIENRHPDLYVIALMPEPELVMLPDFDVEIVTDPFVPVPVTVYEHVDDPIVTCHDAELAELCDKDPRLFDDVSPDLSEQPGTTCRWRSGLTGKRNQKAPFVRWRNTRASPGSGLF